MTIGLLKEPSHETRVSLLPEAVATLTKKNIIVLVESGAGEKAFSRDVDYKNAGAAIASRNEVLQSADLILSIHALTDADSTKTGAVALGVYQPLYNQSLMQQWAAKGITVFSLDMLPRTTRAQSMDVLSSQANIAGYKSVLTAAYMYPRYFPMFMTAAGTIAPAKNIDTGCRCCWLAGYCYCKTFRCRSGSV